MAGRKREQEFATNLKVRYL